MISKRNPFGTTSGVKTFWMLPGPSKPVYLVPRSRAAAVALDPPTGTRNLRRRALAGIQRAGLTRLLPGNRLYVRPSGDHIEEVLSSVLGDVGEVVIRLGRPRVNRALVFWVLDSDGHPQAVVKANTGVEGRITLENEYAALCQSVIHDVPGLRVPEPIAYLRWRGLDLLVLSSLVASRPTRQREMPLRQMKGIAEAMGRTEVPLAETAYVAALRQDLSRIREPAELAWLQEALSNLLREHGALPVPTGCWHGDWVSWNMAFDSGEVLLWDWEHFRADALAGLDHIHFLAQEARRRGVDRAAETAWLAQARTALSETWGLSQPQLEAVIRAYLIDMNARYVRDWQDNDTLPARQGWGRPLIEEMDRTPSTGMRP